ncbi:stalk domain-containing protein [Paenibacillus ginsengarvi]|uniref:Copper amine oxidase-like N-terminal domain-containing protein n=1 Tax=Paenibacillus ginsengarvi TaxID=400777 RepID=A0A3B0B0F8_9BACL|nr:stalk domain-containing protein [Paenibacillus ginsengarvi]RKN66042.1 hypothetical protein D7M11_31705 [Paenibacillus ginsengarvi]
MRNIFGKRKQMAGIAIVLAGCIAFNGMAGAFGETPPEGVKIKEFSLLDTATDVVGSADFTPEGKKDGHFKLQLSLDKKTTINAVVLRSTDDYGKDNYQGVWRTNRVTTGWILGIVQDKTVTTASGIAHENIIINPGFRKDVKEPVGEFEGELTFNLYASDNGTIKETQHYVLEIETQQGTVISKPIKYKKPATAEGSAAPVPSPSPVQNPAPTPTPAPAPSPAPADEAKDIAIHVRFKGSELQFGDAQPVVKEGRTLVPFRPLFEALGFTVNWVEDGNARRAIGKKNGLSIELTIDSSQAMVNGKTVGLDVPAQIIDGRTMVPLRFVSENSGYRVAFSSSGNVWSIQIEEAVTDTSTPTDPVPTPTPAPIPDPVPAPIPTPAPSAGEVEPYIVKGYLRDAQGQPLSGVTIYADNQLFYDSNLGGVTDENGFYRIELAHLPTTWIMSTSFTRSYNGKDQRFYLRSDVDLPFAGSAGAIRHFTLKDVVGHIEIHPDFWSFDDNMPKLQMNDLEITLTPVGPLFDGSSGKSITARAGALPTGGHGVDRIPLGRYKISAVWKPEGHTPVPMLVKVKGSDKFVSSIDFDFQNPFGTASIFVNEFDIKPGS